jgi:hypothetical protein
VVAGARKVARYDLGDRRLIVDDEFIGCSPLPADELIGG